MEIIYALTCLIWNGRMKAYVMYWNECYVIYVENSIKLGMYVLIACQVFEGADVNRDIVNCQVKDIITSIFSFEKYIVKY